MDLDLKELGELIVFYRDDERKEVVREVVDFFRKSIDELGPWSGDGIADFIETKWGHAASNR